MEMDIRKLCFHCFQEKANPAGACPHCGYDPATQGQYPLALPAGSVLAGRYIVGRVLGQGGFGITYVALDVQKKIRVAVKEYMPESMATRQGGTLQVTAFSGGQSENFSYGKDQFLEEARTLAKFAGVNGIVSVHTYFEENGTAYFAMEYVEGTSFKSLIKKNGGKVSWQVARSVLIPVMSALGEVHQAGIIHRDVTPDNIYINSEGAVKLLDFGAARYSIGDRSRSLDVVLKAGYAPKEQYVRRGRQGPFTDVYSVAASFYASMTGYLPPESLVRMEEDDLVPPSSRGVAIPPAAEDAILKGLEVRAEDRYQSMAVFADALMAADPSPLLPIFPGAKPPLEAAAHPVNKQISFTPAAAPVPPVRQPVQQPVQQVPVAPVPPVQPAPQVVVQTAGANVSVAYANAQNAPVQPPVQQPVVQQPVQQPVQTPVQQPVQQPAPAPVGPASYTPPAKKNNTGLFIGIGVAGGVLLLLLVALVIILLGGKGGNNGGNSSYVPTSSYEYSSYPESVPSSEEESSQIITYENGDVYEGGVVDGVPNGQGVYTWSTGSKFEGTFAAGYPDGEGTFTYADGTTKQSNEWHWVAGDEYSYTGGEYEGQLACYYNGMAIGNEAYGYGSFEYVENDPFCPGWYYEGEMNDDDANGKGYLEVPWGGYYLGYVAYGYPEGEGTFYFENGNTMSGEWTWVEELPLTYYCVGETGNTTEFIETMLYSGMYCNDDVNGYGTLNFVDGGTFSGEFEYCCVTGYGRYAFVDGTVVEGDAWTEEMNVTGHSGLLFDGEYVGYGLYFWDDGAEWYRGEYKAGYRGGYGTYHFPSGNEYVGEWVDGDRTGYGVFTWSDGDVYSGDFVEGVQTGYGVFIFGDTGTEYAGDFVDGSFEGYGVMTWTNGERYEGEYMDGKRHGQGTYSWPNGDSYTGEWLEGERTGYGKYTYADGTVQEGQWSNGEFLG